jgi:hypothetical protein
MTEYDNLPSGYSRSDYRGMINYENILAGHITNCMKYRDVDPKTYCSSIETLIIWCPEEIRNKGLIKMDELKLGRGNYENSNREKILRYDDLIMYINLLLETRNIIFKTGTFEIGHD